MVAQPKHCPQISWFTITRAIIETPKLLSSKKVHAKSKKVFDLKAFNMEC